MLVLAITKAVNNTASKPFVMEFDTIHDQKVKKEEFKVSNSEDKRKILLFLMNK